MSFPLSSRSLSYAAHLLLLLIAAADERPFTYSTETTSEGYGLYDWDEVERPQYYFDWERYIHYEKMDNQCKWDGRRQSPVNIVEPADDQCNGLEPYDNHRWILDHGNCYWNNLTWDIKPWGLYMTFPMPDDDTQDYEQIPCRKPNLNSSGGLKNRYYATHVTLKARSEHYLFGKQYDAEINIAHTRFYDGGFDDPNNETAFIMSILVNAADGNSDNPILEPYLREWKRVFDNTNANCAARNLAASASANDGSNGRTLRTSKRDPIPSGTSSLNDISRYPRRRLPDDGTGDTMNLGTWAVFPEFNVYSLLTTPWFYRYTGSLTMPQCFNRVFWRILEQPIEISVRQREMVDQMISGARDPTTCELSTVGVPRDDNSGYVDVARPLQELSEEKSQLMHCDKHDFASHRFFHSPRGNTGWKVLKEENLEIPDSYWDQDYADYNVTIPNGPGDISALTDGEYDASNNTAGAGTAKQNADQAKKQAKNNRKGRVRR